MSTRIFYGRVTRKRAWVSVKLAQTLDGKITDEYGSSKWITGEKSRLFVQELRRTMPQLQWEGQLWKKMILS